MDNAGSGYSWMWVLLTFGILWWIFLSGNSESSNSLEGYSGRYGETYEEYEQLPVTSDNWECTDDCSGHEAGYEWAADNGISDPDDCGGKSDSFIEGCEAYANEQMMETDEDYSDYESEGDYLY